MSQFLIKSEIRTEQDIVWARKKTRDIATFLKLDKQEQIRLATAVSELARNVIHYAVKGFIEYNLINDDQKVYIQIKVMDQGPGIKDLKSIINGTYISPTGMGVGLIGSKKLVDGLNIDSSSSGTTITIRKYVPQRISLLSVKELKELLDTFIFRENNPIEEIQKQNEEILLTVAALNEKKEELDHLNQELEDTNRGVVALYAELDEKAESLRQANESKTKFLSDMTHEFRSPLNSILSISDILLGEAKDEKNLERERQVNFIIKAAQGLSDLVNDLLDIAKIEAGKIPVRVDSFSVSDLFSTMRGLMKPLSMGNTSVVLNFNEVDNNLYVRSDEGKTAQMLRNLISNAIKYTEKGEINVSAEKNSQGEIILEVKDTGIGIPKDQLESIFGEFVQVSNRLQQKAKGTGLGLSLTHKLATLLGGRIEVESEVDVGSTFRIILPSRYLGPEDAIYESRKELKPLSNKLRKVLVIDDDDINRTQVANLCHKLHLEVLEAQNGQMGLEIARAWTPDIIVLDLVMPIMDGYGFIRNLILEERLKDIPIIMNTSKDLSQEELLYLEQVTNIVLRKDERNVLNIELILKKLLEQENKQ